MIADKKTLRILMVEDSKSDAEIMLHLIKRSGYEVVMERVETKESMKGALSRGEWDVIISDYSLPQFSGEGALETLKESDLDLPFILVSGTVGEETAVKMMKAGADDYLLKDKMERLIPAIEREIGEFLNRKARRKAETELRRNQKQLAFLSEASGVLGSSLEYEETINRSIQLAIPEICDYCVVDLMNRRIRTGKPEMISEVSESLLVSIARDQEHLHLLRGLGIKSCLCVPMIMRGEVLGSVMFFMGESNRHFTDSDFSVFQEFARRAASAIDNAWLYREAQHAIKARDEFLMIASHEFKTPITSLKMNLEIMRRGVSTESGLVPSAPELAKSIDVSITQVNRLTKLIEDMMDATRLQIGKLSFELGPVHLGMVIHEILERFANELKTARCVVEVKVDSDIVGNWDKSRIEQVVVNLISNAIKYAAGSKILITATQNSSRAWFTIQDSGPGISKEKQSSIFERYERATADHNIVGLGLGLFICRQIIEAHGGTIRVQSEEGKGTSFIIDLPLVVDVTHKFKGITFTNGLRDHSA